MMEVPMSAQPEQHPGQVTATPEGGPIDQGPPTPAPGFGQVQITPEAGPLTPPTMEEHMQGPILGLDDRPAASGQAAPAAAAHQEPAPSTRTQEDDRELRKWPPYSGKPVSEVHWDDARRFAAPVVSQAEKLAIRAIDLSATGLSKLARYLETRRAEREREREP
jgi:hypothetical protein